MNDKAMLRCAARYREVSDEIKELEAEKKRLQKKIVEAMEEKGVEAVEGEGLRVKWTVRRDVFYDTDILRKNLDRKVFEKITTRVIDKERLALAIQKKILSTALLEKATQVRESAPSIRVSLQGPEDDE